jgi:hypothetical protein
VAAGTGAVTEHADLKPSVARGAADVADTNAAATPPPGPPTSAGRTELITEVAVGAEGQLANGYSEAPAGNSTQLSGCDSPSPAAVSGNIYSCYPSAAAADVCWPSPPTSMLCMNNPWDKEVRRLPYDTSLLATVQPPKTPEPFALMLDNGTHCLYISGGARRARSDGYIPDYACGADLRYTFSAMRVAAIRSTGQTRCGLSHSSNRTFRPKCGR